MLTEPSEATRLNISSWRRGASARVFGNLDMRTMLQYLWRAASHVADVKRAVRDGCDAVLDLRFVVFCDP
ncbi:hypothetical protein [Sinorhizobium meliloti]|uniref:hypothetical protein n=1 Tax=Rhizobium meliloti TaxID=382 RepID=UPI0013E3DBC3|nr:hypothetical protein [Sinorhizobium meliloti]